MKHLYPKLTGAIALAILATSVLWDAPVLVQCIAMYCIGVTWAWFVDRMEAA